MTGVITSNWDEYPKRLAPITKADIPALANLVIGIHSIRPFVRKTNLSYLPNPSNQSVGFECPRRSVNPPNFRLAGYPQRVTINLCRKPALLSSYSSSFKRIVCSSAWLKRRLVKNGLGGHFNSGRRWSWTHCSSTLCPLQ